MTMTGIHPWAVMIDVNDINFPTRHGTAIALGHREDGETVVYTITATGLERLPTAKVTWNHIEDVTR